MAKNVPLTSNWMVDSVISGFFMMISDIKGNGGIAITAQEALHVHRGEGTSLLFSSMQEKPEYHDWTKVDHVLIPFNKDQNHWVTIVLRPRNKEILGQKIFLSNVCKNAIYVTTLLLI